MRIIYAHSRCASIAIHFRVFAKRTQFVRFFADLEIPCSPQSLEMIDFFKRLNGSQIAGAQYDGVFPLVGAWKPKRGRSGMG